MKCETCAGDEWISREILVTFWAKTNKPQTKQVLDWDAARELAAKVDPKAQVVTSEAIPCPRCKGADWQQRAAGERE